VYQEEWLGKAVVMQIFHVKKASSIAGCLIKEGLLRRSEHARVLRSGKVVYDRLLKTLRHLKDDVREKTADHFAHRSLLYKPHSVCFSRHQYTCIEKIILGTFRLF
jgi:hypothetical protein